MTEWSIRHGSLIRAVHVWEMRRRAPTPTLGPVEYDGYITAYRSAPLGELS